MDGLDIRPARELILTNQQLQQMLDHSAAVAPEEACGLVAGVAGRAQQVIPATNTLHSPVRYRMEPLEQLKAFQRIESSGWELLAIYHSHPAGPSRPSPTDIQEAAYPGVVHLIWSRIDHKWRCKGFIIEMGAVEEVPLKIL